MAVPVRLQYFRVDACGYYPRNAHEPSFGPLRGLLDDLGTWILDGNLNIAQTQTYDAADDGRIMPCYCFNIRHAGHGRTGLLTTWNETETVGDSFASVQGDSVVGAGEVDVREVPAGGIPGFPAYFWIVPERRLIVSIRIRNQRLNGHQELRRYLQGFLESFSRHCVLAEVPEDDGSFEIIGWARDEASPTTRFRPRFRSSPLREETERDRLRQRVVDISRVFMKKTLRSRRAPDRGLYQNLMRQLNLPRTPIGTSDIAFNADFECRPSLVELDAIIEAYDAGQMGLADVGFRVAGEPSPVWLSSSSTNRDFELDFQLSSEGIADSESLLDALVDQRRRILPLRDVANE